jgi:hypothetical protein
MSHIWCSTHIVQQTLRSRCVRAVPCLQGSVTGQQLQATTVRACIALCCCLQHNQQSSSYSAAANFAAHLGHLVQLRRRPPRANNLATREGLVLWWHCSEQSSDVPLQLRTPHKPQLQHKRPVAGSSSCKDCLFFCHELMCKMHVSSKPTHAVTLHCSCMPSPKWYVAVTSCTGSTFAC